MNHIRNTIDVLWLKRQLVSRPGAVYRIYGYYAESSVTFCEFVGEPDLQAGIDKAIDFIKQEGFCVGEIKEIIR